MDNVDALKERVLEERIRILQAKLEVALNQRDAQIHRVPFQERAEIRKDWDDEVEHAGRAENPGQDD